MAAFISMEGNTITIDGSVAGVKQTVIEGDSVVQLRRARTEESGYAWEETLKKTHTVVVKNILVYDATDLACLQWFMIRGCSLDMSASYISPVMLDGFKQACESMAKMGGKVPEGSKICIPQLGGMSGWGRCEGAKMAAQKVGFEAFIA